MAAGAEQRVGDDLVVPLAVEVVDVANPTVEDVERPSAQGAPEREEGAVRDGAVRDVDRHRHGVRPVPNVGRHPLGHRCTTLEVTERVAWSPTVVLVGHRLEHAVVQREHIVATGFVPPQRDELGDLLGVLGGEVVRLGDVLGHVVELPDVFVEGRVGAEAVVVDRSHGVVRDRLPAVVVDGTRAEHLEVLGHVTLRAPSRRRRRRDRRSWCRPDATARSRRSAGAPPRRPARGRSERYRRRARTAGARHHPDRSAGRRAVGRCTGRRHPPRAPRASTA